MLSERAGIGIGGEGEGKGEAGHIRFGVGKIIQSVYADKSRWFNFVWRWSAEYTRIF
jgi:hypothetical protein